MDKNTLSNYGWVVIAVLVLSVMVALATPFGSYIEQGVRSTTQGLFDTSEKAMNIVGMTAGNGNFEDGYNGISGSGESSEPEELVAGAIFGKKTTEGCNCKDEDEGAPHECYINIDPIALTWDELKLTENGQKYGYDASLITDTGIYGAFDNCYSIVSITMPYGITTIDTCSFNGCESLTSITIPNSVTIIGEEAFSNCDSLNNITIPNSVTNIGGYAFCGCNSLTSITIGNGVTSIGNCAFEECNALNSITLGNKLTFIDGYAFLNCYSLTTITIPDSVTSIGDETFAYCYELTAITFSGTKAQWKTISLGFEWNYEVPATVVHCSDGDITL